MAFNRIKKSSGFKLFVDAQRVRTSLELVELRHHFRLERSDCAFDVGDEDRVIAKHRHVRAHLRDVSDVPVGGDTGRHEAAGVREFLKFKLEFLLLVL